MKKEKQFLVSKRNILSEVARWATAQSPYHRPDNLEVVLDTLSDTLENFGNGKAGYEDFSYEDLKQFLGDILKAIPEFNLWNERKNGNKSEYKFVSRYSNEESNPDDDFIDLDALIRNVANSIVRSGTETPMPKILGKPGVKIRGSK